MFRTITVAAALALGTSFATADTAGIDMNGDGLVTPNEYTKAATDTDYSARFDADGDGNITREELNAGLWTMYDLDGDGQWNADETAKFESEYIDSGKTKR